MSGRTLILGGGLGGIAAAVELRRLLGLGPEVLVVDRNLAFVMGLGKLWDLVGRAQVADGGGERRLLERNGIEFVQAGITSIDVTGRSATTSGGALSSDRRDSARSPPPATRDRGRVSTRGARQHSGIRQLLELPARCRQSRQQPRDRSWGQLPGSSRPLGAAQGTEEDSKAA
jgi:hypothetical protein